jgi:hypothetical protein
MTDENISFFMDDDDTNVNEVDLSSFLEEQEDDTMPQIVNYQINFTSRQLTQICDYYNIIKPKKCNKDELAHLIVEFEQNNENAEIVCKRQLMWFYMDELKNDKYMKKYILLW